MAKKKAAKPRAKPPARSAVAVLEQREASDRAKLAAAARRKLNAGESPSRAEARALRGVEKELRERYGPEFVAARGKGDWCRTVGRAPRVVIDLFRRLGVGAYFSDHDTINQDALDRELVSLLIDHGSAIQRSQRSAKLRATGDADPDEINYDEFDARRMRAIALLKENELNRELSTWVPVDILQPLLREVLVTDIRSAVDDYDRREDPIYQQVAARLRQIIERIGTRIDEALDPDGSDEP